MFQHVKAHQGKYVFPGFGCETSLVFKVALEVSIGHEGQDEVRRLAVCIEDNSLHTKHIGMIKGAHKRALQEKPPQFLVGCVIYK